MWAIFLLVSFAPIFLGTKKRQQRSSLPLFTLFPGCCVVAPATTQHPGKRVKSGRLDLCCRFLVPRNFYSVRHGGAYGVLLTYDCLNKPKPVKLVLVATMVILSNRCRFWPMYLCMDSVKFVLEAPGASIVWGRYYILLTSRPFGGGWWGWWGSANFR